MELFWIVVGLVYASMAYLYIRNDRVLKFSRQQLTRVSDAVFRDIHSGDYPIREWSWRFDEFNSVSYDKLLFSLKPLKVENFWDRDPARPER